MLLGKLLKSIKEKYQKIPVKGISFDSRKVKNKDVFFAIDGNNTSGAKFINQAISKGASAIVSNKKIKNKKIYQLLSLEMLEKACQKHAQIFLRKSQKI